MLFRLYHVLTLYYVHTLLKWIIRRLALLVEMMGIFTSVSFLVMHHYALIISLSSSVMHHNRSTVVNK